MDIFCKFDYVSAEAGDSLSIRSDAGSSSPNSATREELVSGLKCAVNDLSTEMIFQSNLNPAIEISVPINAEQESCYYDGTMSNIGSFIEMGQDLYPNWVGHPDVSEQVA